MAMGQNMDGIYTQLCNLADIRNIPIYVHCWQCPWPDLQLCTFIVSTAKEVSVHPGTSF